jgi:hypothetical protein
MVDPVHLEAARASWAESERQLYPAAVSDVHRYQRIVLAVRAMADALSSADSIEQLMSLWATGGEIYASVLAARGMTASALPQPQIIGSAFAMREREIEDRIHRQGQLALIAAARAAGQTWVVLGESGKVEAGLDDPYRCTEMHLPSGLAIVSQLQPDPSGRGEVFAVSAVKLDPATGALLDADPGIEPEANLARPEDFVLHRDTMRKRIQLRHAKTI